MRSKREGKADPGDNLSIIYGVYGSDAGVASGAIFLLRILTVPSSIKNRIKELGTAWCGLHGTYSHFYIPSKLPMVPPRLCLRAYSHPSRRYPRLFNATV